jgi:hypothetical protein
MDVPYWTGKSCTSLLNPPSKKAVCHSEALDDCRHENQNFYQQVLNLIPEKS